jgi:acetylornithine deacetylase/succinyl-diaminopimelate desuccinylase-like protein
MKSTGIAQLMAFLLLHRMKVPLQRDVIFLATADEEAGGEFGAGWVVKHRPEWIRGAGFLLNEGARSAADKNGRVRYIGFGATEKTPAWLKLIATGTPGHGSVPRPASAVNRLIAALERLRKHEEQAPLEVTPPIARAFRSQAAYEEEPWRTRFRDIGAFLKTPNARAELEKRPGVLALLHNTISITGLEGTKKINIIPPVATALLDCRLLPGWTIERWVKEVKRLIADESIQVEVVLNFPPAESPVDTPLYAAIAAAAKDRHQAGLAETVSAGFTDSHFFREKGIVSYGFGAFAIGEDEGGRAHGNDERIGVKAFTEGVRLYWEVVARFARK